MIKFNDYFRVKFAPSYPGPKTSDVYCGLATSDNNLFLFYNPTQKWFKTKNQNWVKYKNCFEEYCENSEDVDKLVNIYLDYFEFEEI